MKRHLSERDRRFLEKKNALADNSTYRRGFSRDDHDMIEIAAVARGESGKAIKLFDGNRTEWVPTSQIKDNGDGTFSMPIWLAKDKGFI